MPSSPQQTPAIPNDLRIQSLPAAHLPVIGAVIDAIGITEVFDEALPMDARSKVSDTDCMKVMLANILSGRCSLLQMNEWLSRVDAQQLVSSGSSPEHFNDQRLAACLDRVHAYGTDNLMYLVAKQYLEAEPEESTIARLDHTTLSLYGDYEAEHQLGTPRPAHGHSKDHKPHLKQLLFGMVLAGNANAPIAASVLDGNTAESKANRLHLDKVAQLMPSPESVTLVADCKLVDRQTLGSLDQQGLHFISMLPATYKLRSELIERVRVADDALDHVLQGAWRSKRTPARTYRAKSFIEPMSIGGAGEEKRIKTLRFVVVESDDHDHGLTGTVERSLKRDLKTYEREKKALLKKEFACEPDAHNAIAALQAKLKLHEANLAPVAVSEPVKRSRPGRPRKDEVREERSFFRVEVVEPPRENAELVERADFHARHFVLVTDHLDEAAWPDERVLREYRAQQVIEGHTGFRWLKNIALVAPIFLHLPTRIAALSLLFVLALMVRNYMQATIRAGLKAKSQSLPDRRNRPTQKPTMETSMRQLAAVVTTRIYVGDQLVEKRVQGLPEAGRQVLALLGLDEDVFLKPPGSRKWGRVCHRMAGM